MEGRHSRKRVTGVFKAMKRKTPKDIDDYLSRYPKHAVVVFPLLP
jgi:hypothetical protein